MGAPGVVDCRVNLNYSVETLARVLIKHTLFQDRTRSWQ